MWFALLAVSRLVTGQSDPDIFQFPWHELKLPHILKIRSQLADKYSISTGNLYLAALRGTLRAAWKLDLMDRDHLERLLDFGWIDGTSLPPGRALNSDEIDKIFRVVTSDDSVAGVRDAAMIALLYSTGMRRTEMSTFQVESLEESGQGYRGKVSNGKGRRDRYVYMNPAARVILDRWQRLRGYEPGVLIPRIDRLPRIVRMDPQTVYDILKRRSAQAGIAQVRPHDWRRTMITTLLEQGVDIFTVQKLAGHALAETTRAYDRRGEESLIDAAFSLYMPTA